MSQPLLKDPIVVTGPTRTGTGTGTVTVDKLTHFTTAQTYTLVCIAKSPDTIFSVSGSLDGPVGLAVVGTQFFDADLKVFLTIQQGATVFEVGDKFVIAVQNGTDLNQDNIDLYDQLPQKNFGVGVKGTLAGDQSIRYSDTAVPAWAFLQGLKFLAATPGANGNNLQVQTFAPVPGVVSTGTLDGLTFTSLAANAAANNLTMNFLPAVTPFKATATIQNVNYQALVFGSPGNAISVNYTTGGTHGAEVVTVSGNAITVQIESGVSTSGQIVAAVSASAAASALVSTKVAPKFDNSTQTAPVSATFLTGGITGQGTAGNEIVTVSGQAITVQCENGVSTQTQVKAALDASPAASALITTAITGTNTDPISGLPVSTVNASPTPATFSGGADAYGYVGSEKVTVVSNLIKLFLESGRSTASAVVAAFNASTAALALASVAIVGNATDVLYSPGSLTQFQGGLSRFFSFNQHELSNPANFHEGNASVKVQDLTVQGIANFSKPVEITDRLSLEDSSTESGPHIPNVQRYINRMITLGKMTVRTSDNSTVRWSAGQLFFTSNILIEQRDTGVTGSILLANSPISLADGQSLYVVLNPATSGSLVPIISTSVDKGVFAFRLVTRFGVYLDWFNGMLQNDGDITRIGGQVDYRDQVLTLLADGGIVTHSSTTIGLISWDAPIHVRPLGSSVEISIPSSSVSMNDGDVSYIQLDDPLITATKTMVTSPRSVAELSRVDRYWIFYRSGSKVYVRGGGTLVPGENRTIGEPISNDLFTFIGSSQETDTAPSYTTKGHKTTATANRFLTDGENLVSGSKTLDTALASHEDATQNVHGVGTGNSVVGTGTSQVLTNKDIDGGTASDTDRITVPKNTSSNLAALTRKEGTVVYDVDSHRMFIDDGTDLKPVGSGGSVLVDAYDLNTLTLPTTTAYIVDGQTITNGMIVLFDKLSSGPHKAYKATVTGSAVTWAAQSLFASGSTPGLGEEIRVKTGTSYAFQLGVYDGTTFKFNNFVRFFNGQDYYEQSALSAVAIAASTTATVFSVAYAASENVIVDFSILRGTVKEVGTLHITTDGTKAVVAQSGAAIGSTGINFSASIVSGNLVLSYTSDASGTGILKVIVRRWSNGSGGTAGVPSYGAASGSTTPAAGSSGQIQFNGGGNLSGDAALTYDQSSSTLNLSGKQTVGLKSFTVGDNVGSPAPVITYDATTYPFTIVEYSIKRDTAFRVGRLFIATNGTNVTVTDENATVGDTGVAFLGVVSGTNVVLQYLSSSTGLSGTLKYELKRWS